MKKYVISMMLILTLVFSTAVTFADVNGEGAEGNGPVVVEGAGDVEDPQVVEPEADDPDALVGGEEEDDPEEVIDETTNPEEEKPAAKGVTKAPALTKGGEEPVNEGTEEGSGETIAPNSWNKDRTMYYGEDCNPVKGLFKAKKTDGVGALFYADENGLVKKTEGIVTIPGDKTRYVMQTDSQGSKGFVEVTDNTKPYTYFFATHDSGDVAATELPGIHKCSEGSYLVLDNCTVRIDEGFEKLGSDTYFINDKGQVETSEKLVTYNGKKYIVKSGGKVNTATGIQTCAGKKYYVSNSSGEVLATQGFTPAVNGSKYVVQADASIKTTAGFMTVGSKKYYVANGGAVRATAGSFKANDGKWYLADTGGAIVTTKGVVKRGGKYYYVSGTSGVLAINKVQTVGKKKYHVTANGVIAVGPHKWKNVYYYSNKSGVLQTKVKKNKWTNGKYYFTKKSGKLYVNTKFKVKGKTYIANKSGVVLTGFFKWKKARYYASKYGVVRVKQGVMKNGLYRYYVYSGGKIAVNKKVKAGKKTYFATEDDGHLKIGVFKWKDGKYYYTDKNGLMRTKVGMFTYNGKKYYCKGGSLAVKSFVKSNDKYYYCGDEAYVMTKSFKYKGKTIRPNSKTGEIDEEIYYELFPNERPQEEEEVDE